MKKTNLFSALALASCVMLSGCGKNKPEEPTVDPKLTVADLPHLVAGEEFDVSSYVTAQDGSGAVTITLDASCQDFASLDSTATKITATHSGEIKFTVHYGDLTVDCTAAVDSKEYLAYVEATKNPIMDYYHEEYSSDQLAYANYYSEDVYLEYDGKEFTGFVEIDGQIYTYTVIPAASEEEDDSLEFSISGNEPETMSDVCAPYGLPASLGVQKYVPAEEDEINAKPVGYECISFTSKEALYAACSQALGYDPERLEHLGITFTEAQVLPEEYEYEGETYTSYFVALFMTGPGYIWGIDEPTAEVFMGGYIDFGRAQNIDIIKSLLPEEAPTGVDTSAIFDLVNPKIDDHSFGLSYTFGWFDSEMNPLDSNPFYDPTSATFGQMIVDYLNAIGFVTAAVTPDQIAVAYANSDFSKILVKGLVNHDGNVYSYGGNASENLPASLIAAETSIYADEEVKNSSISFNFLKELSDVFVNAYDEDQGFYTLSYAACADVMYKLLVSVLPEMVPWVQPTSLAEQVALSFDLGNMIVLLGEESFMLSQSLSMSYDATNDDLSFQLVIPETMTDPTTQQKVVYYYVISISISSFGSGQDVFDYALPPLTIEYPDE